MSEAAEDKPRRVDRRKLSAICAIAKNEAPYIAEWATYHRMIGFDHILVYNNESTDSTRDVLASLEKQGLLTFVDWASSPDGRTQKRAYADGLRRLRADFQWIAFIDLDEFFAVPGFDNSIRAFLNAYKDRDAIAVNWKLFGTSGHSKRGDGLVVERFTRCAETHHSGNRAVKTIARTDALLTPNLHNHDFAEGVVYATVSGDVIAPGTGKSKTVSHDIISLHHYFTKSREEWDLKVARGRATKPDNHPDKLRREEHFTMHNRNEVEDSFLARLGAELRQAMPSDIPQPTSRAVAEVASGKVSYSQFAEDLVAESLLMRAGKLTGAGTYIDVGACWPIKYSNTFAYYQRGWRGLCIDPRPGFEVAFSLSRPGDICVNVGIAAAETEMEYYAFENDVFNTFDRERAIKLDAIGRGGRTLAGRVNVPVRPLQSVIEETLGVDREIDLVSIDVEGLELDVLSSIDWEVTKPTLFIIEQKSKSVQKSLKSPIATFMVAQGYECVSATNQNVYFLRKDSV